MLALVCLAVVAVAQATPAGKTIPVFEDVANLRIHADPRVAPHTYCSDDCHHHILNHPVFVVRSLPGSHSVHYAPIGLNGLAKSPLTMGVHEAIVAPESNVIAIFPFARFPFELFPGLLDAEMVVPEHAEKLVNFYKEAPVVAIFPEEHFRKINEHRGLIQVADLSGDSTGFTIAKDHALLNRNAALGLSSAATPLGVGASPSLSPAVSPLAPATHGIPTGLGQGVAPPASFAPVPAKSGLFPIASGYTHFGGSGIGIGGGEAVKYIPNVPAGQTYYSSVPIY